MNKDQYIFESYRPQGHCENRPRQSLQKRIQEETFFNLFECAMGVTATEDMSDDEKELAPAAAAAATLAAVAVAAMVFCAPSRS